MKFKKKGTCPTCGQEYEQTRKEKLQRNITVSLLASISSVVPAGKVACEQHKDDCFKCFRKAVLEAIGPAYAGMLGQQLEEAEADETEKSEEEVID